MLGECRNATGNFVGQNNCVGIDYDAWNTGNIVAGHHTGIKSK